MASEMKTIYSLSDPRTGEIRYIGRTSDVAARMRAHSNASAAEGTPLHAWLTELKKRKLSPVLTDLARVWHDGTCDVDRHPLDPVADGGNSARKPPDAAGSA